jgi:hypothetical protein
MLAWVTARPIRASRVVRLAVASIVGVVLIFCGLWLALRPNDMGSYEPNCFPRSWKDSMTRAVVLRDASGEDWL